MTTYRSELFCFQIRDDGAPTKPHSNMRMVFGCCNHIKSRRR